MLNRAQFNAIRKALLDHLKANNLEAAPTNPAELVALLRQVTPEATNVSLQAITSFAIPYLVRSGAIAAGSPEHFALRQTLGLPEPKPWHKAFPPKNFFQLLDASRNPEWCTEMGATTPIARTLTFADLISDELISAAIRSHFDIGGMEDLGDPRAVQSSDPTMALLIEAVKHAALSSRPEWHDANTGSVLTPLPPGIDNRSTDEVEAERALQLEIRRKEVAKARAKERREKENAEYNGVRSVVLGTYKDVASKALAATLAGPSSDFETVKTHHEASIPEALAETVTKIKDYLAAKEVVPAGASEVEILEITREVADRAKAFTIQLVLDDMNDAQPTWFRRLANGALTFRPAPYRGAARAPGHVTKYEKAAARAIAMIVDKYDPATLNFALKAITGQELAGPVLPVARPTWLAVSGGAEEIVVEPAAGHVALTPLPCDSDTGVTIAPPPPPVAPVAPLI